MGKAKAFIGLGIALAAVVALVAVAGWAFYGESGHVYVKVDNARVAAIEPHAGMEHEYRLDGVAADGAHSEIAFQTSRELREGAYLDLETKPLRGVIGWEEVAYDDLPAAVQDKLPQEG
ncbi:YxeA family protein [Gordonibacter massiliensis (ex Traore et al. 2017)]|uniref:YxeA family protein n=1 Tax=Gordonibacter massiliensis (ex Traore et al. 2017) TaxID=1841863 RepID=UPI001C8C3D4E|nr:YxeA family protein [Gordonibacter massiliensis (ex Traore et al. 2017)]MBX9035434.1 YxeA family protein [Gordonibacter massiliensis (ex Traore et al. 2017)]